MATITGNGDGTFPALTGDGAGSVWSKIDGDGDGTFPSLTGSGTGHIVNITGAGSGSLPKLSGAGTGLPWVRNYTWAIQIKLDDVDITSWIIGTPVVEAGESQSGIANIVYIPASPPGDLRGKSLEVLVNIGGGLRPIHLGTVIKSDSDFQTGRYSLQSSTKLQEYFRALADDDAVLAALPGAVYSDAVFGNNEDRWKWAQDALSTIPYECHITATGAMEVRPWAAKDTADHTLTGADVHNVPSHAYTERAGDEQVNRVIIEYGYGFQRWKSREHAYSYHLSYNNPTNHTTWCDWYGASGEDAFDLPLVDTIRSAIAGTGWAVSYEQYDGHPLSATCEEGVPWEMPDETLDSIRVTNATARLFKNYTQPIGEDYTLTVESSASITRYGTITRTRSVGRDIESDDDTFTDDVGLDTTWDEDAIGDYYQDQDDEDTRANDIQCALQVAHVQIWERHRNYLKVITDINPAITLKDTIQLSNVVLRTGTLAAKGKVFSLVYRLDPKRPTMELTLAITRGAGGTGDTLEPPDRPDTEPTHEAPDSSTILNNHVGYRLDSTPYYSGGDDWTGWLVNSKGVFTLPNIPSGDQIYPNEFRIDTIGIEDEAANEFAATSEQTYNVDIPDDDFAIT